MKHSRTRNSFYAIPCIFFLLAIMSLPASLQSAEAQERSLSLRECVEIALEDNLQLQVQSYNPRLAIHNEGPLLLEVRFRVENGRTIGHGGMIPATFARTASLRWNGVITKAAPRMTAQNPANPEQATLQRPVCFHRLEKIVRATRFVTAAPPARKNMQDRPQELLVATDGRLDNPLHLVVF